MTKVVHLYASQRVSRRAKDGSDGTSVTIISKSVTYQISASGTEAPTGTWSDKVVLTTDTKPYLWTRTIVVYSDTNSTTSYSVSYRGKDGTNGTSFTPKGMADGYYRKATEIPAYSDEQNGKIYLVDDATNVTSPFIVPDAPYVAQYVLHDGEYVLFLVHAEFGDVYNVNGHLYVANDDKWVDFGEIQGAKGDQGDPGIDAINIVFSPAELVFDADENGNLIQAEKSAEIKVYRGTTELQYKTDWDNDAEIGDNCWAALLVNTTTNKPEVKISGITSSNIDDVKVPATSGGANVSVIVDGVKYRAYLPFSVNVNTYANFLIRDNKKYISKYTEISNKYNTLSNELNGKASKDELREVSSSIEQTARRISLEVSSNAVGRRNMLVNSAFRNQDSVFIHSLARIEKNTGLDGVNCIHSSDKYSGTGDGNFIGAFWDSTQKNGVVTNIPIRKGKKYVISCWIKSDNKYLPFFIECFFMNSINQQNRGEDSIRKEYHVDNVNEWKRIDFVVDTTDTSEYASKVTPYLAVNFWSNTKYVPKATGATEYPTCHAYICKPMMEEGDTYGGWTLSENDYEYVGGNILDNTRSLEKSGNLEKEESEIINEGYEYAYAVAHSNNTTSANIEMLQWNVAGRINDGQDYMFSFLAKGTGMVNTYLFKDETPRFFVESSNNIHNDVSEDGDVYFELTKEWKRYWVHYHFNTSSEHPLPEKLLIRCYRGNEVYICKPKLEIGATMTEFTERKTDLVDKASLKKAGIEITSEQVTLYGNKVQVKTPKANPSEGYDEAAMFQGGKLNAHLIDADKIEVKHLWAKSEDGTTKVGYFGNYEIDACKVDDTTYAPLFVGADNAKNAPFHVTQNGAIYALMGRIGKFTLTDDGIFEYDYGTGGTHKPMRLSENCLFFTHTTDNTTNDRIIWMGYTSHVHPDYGISSLISDIWIDDKEYRPTSSKACLVLCAEGGTSDQSNLLGEPSGNFAICASKGMYAGLRPVTRKVNKSITLSDMDCFVIVTKGVTLTLPAKPQRGQYYKFLQAGDNFVIKSSSNNLYWYKADGVSSFTSGAYNQTTELIYDGSSWHVNWFREAAV